MPTLPLYKPAAHPDAAHDVLAPGGYEWWYFDAEDPSTRRHLVAILLNGFIFHPGYLRRHARWRFWPTCFHPPLPQDHACAYFILYQDGKVTHQFMTQYPASRFSARSDRPEVTIGPNRLMLNENAMSLEFSGTPWILTWRGPKLIEHQMLKAQLRFTSRLSAAAQERVFLSRALTGAEHHWILANPLCDVRATIQCGDETIEFKGQGYHDHNFGTAPIGPGLRRWLWGRMLFGDSVCTFHYVQPRNRDLAEEIHLVEADLVGTREIPISGVSGEWSRRSGWGLRYPQQLKFGQVLELGDPQLVDSSPFYLRLIYDARFRKRQGKAFCELAYPHRLRLPILGRMIEMSIDRRGLAGNK